MIIEKIQFFRKKIRIKQEKPWLILLVPKVGKITDTLLKMTV